MAGPEYDRSVLLDVLIYHWRNGIEGCGCGWAVLGASWPAHVADIYEESVLARAVQGEVVVAEVAPGPGCAEGEPSE